MCVVSCLRGSTSRYNDVDDVIYSTIPRQFSSSSHLKTLYLLSFDLNNPLFDLSSIGDP